MLLLLTAGRDSTKKFSLQSYCHFQGRTYLPAPSKCKVTGRFVISAKAKIAWEKKKKHVQWVLWYTKVIINATWKKKQKCYLQLSLCDAVPGRFGNHVSPNLLFLWSFQHFCNSCIMTPLCHSPYHVLFLGKPLLHFQTIIAIVTTHYIPSLLINSRKSCQFFPNLIDKSWYCVCTFFHYIENINSYPKDNTSIIVTIQKKHQFYEQP